MYRYAHTAYESLHYAIPNTKRFPQKTRNRELPTFNKIMKRETHKANDAYASIALPPDTSINSFRIMYLCKKQMKK